MKLFKFLIPFCLCFNSLSWATEEPKIERFDVVEHCNDVAGFGGTFSQQLYDFCFDKQQSEYNELKTIWGDVDTTISKHCHGVAKFGGAGSYQLLNFCVKKELAAKVKNSTKKFEF